VSQGPASWGALVLLGVAAAGIACGGPGRGSPTGGTAQCPVPEYVPAPARSWPCPSAAEVEAIRSDVEIDFEVDPTEGTLVCTAAAGSADLTRLEERLFQAIALMRHLEFDAPLPWTGEALYPWFVHSVRGVRFRVTENSFCCEPPGVINIAVHPERNAVYDDGFPTLIEGLVHEARHADGGHLHNCGYKDQTLAEMGAWGVQYSLDLWMGRHSVGTVLTPQEREYCLNRAAWIAAGNFCTECPPV
jgi:hypothetical protein